MSEHCFPSRLASRGVQFQTGHECEKLFFSRGSSVFCSEDERTCRFLGKVKGRTYEQLEKPGESKATVRDIEPFQITVPLKLVRDKITICTGDIS